MICIKLKAHEKEDLLKHLQSIEGELKNPKKLSEVLFITGILETTKKLYNGKRTDKHIKLTETQAVALLYFLPTYYQKDSLAFALSIAIAEDITCGLIKQYPTLKI